MTTTTSFAPAEVTAAQAPAVVLDDVTKRYGRGRSAVTALDHLSLSFPAGSFTAVLGVSGSGKSTLLQCAAGLERLTSGAVRLAGTELTRLSHRRQAVLRRRQVGFVFQDLNLVPELSVAENIALPLRLDHRRVEQGHIRQAAARVGLLPGQLRRQTAAGTTVVIVTHDPQAVRFCDRAVFLHSGRVARVVHDPDPAAATAVLHQLGERGNG